MEYCLKDYAGPVHLHRMSFCQLDMSSQTFEVLCKLVGSGKLERLDAFG
jgi:hypothetical protein